MLQSRRRQVRTPPNLWVPELVLCLLLKVTSGAAPVDGQVSVGAATPLVTYLPCRRLSDSNLLSLYGGIGCSEHFVRCIKCSHDVRKIPRYLFRRACRCRAQKMLIKFVPVLHGMFVWERIVALLDHKCRRSGPQKLGRSQAFSLTSSSQRW